VAAGLLGEAPPVPSRDIRECVFGTVLFRAGYDEAEVDRFLDELAAAIDHLRQTEGSRG